MGDLKKKELLDESVFTTDLARGFYNHYYHLLESQEIVKEIDAFAMLNMCHCLDSIYKLREELNLNPMVIDSQDTHFGEKVTKKANPLWAILNQQEKMFLAYCKEFGITPSSRAKFFQDSLKVEILEKRKSDGIGGESGISTESGDIFDAI